MVSNVGVIKNRSLLKTAVFVFITTIFCSDASAWRGHGHYYHHPYYHHSYYYHPGMYYHPGRIWFDFEFVAPVVGTIVTSLPYGYTSVRVGNVTYLYLDGTYLRPCSRGYVVVPAPSTKVTVASTTTDKQQTKQAAQTTAQSSDSTAIIIPSPLIAASTGDSVVVNVPDKDGGFTPVTLIKHADGYIGPQGEFYKDHPTVEQLKVLYGK